MYRTLRSLNILLLPILLLSACTTVSPTPMPASPIPPTPSLPAPTQPLLSKAPETSPTAAATPSATPGATLTPTSKPSPSATPLPSITPTIAPPLSAAEALENLLVTGITNFEQEPEQTWTYSVPGVNFANGKMEVSGNKTWDTSASPKRSFKEGQGVILRYQFAVDSVFEMYLDNGQWNTPDYKRIGAGVYTGGYIPRVNLFLGLNNLGGPDLTGNFTPRPGIWYNALLAVSPKSEFLIEVWDPNAPTQRFRYREVVNPQWGGLTWNFTVKSFQGSLLVEEVAEIQFTRVK